MDPRPIKKIVVIGPESTGKSTLCELLAQHYQGSWCPEFAREYLLTHGTDYHYEDLLQIAKGQLAMEDEYLTSIVNGEWPIKNTGSAEHYSPFTNHHSPLFIDTDMYVMKVWCEYFFGKCHPWILKQIAARKYDLYLLCNTDLPWVKDELREYPDLKTRETLFYMYKDLLVNQTTPWVEVSGDYEARLQTAIAAVDKLLAG
jgi:NadR type nicotinamide-nucleotide adenylyltransferase